MAKKLVSLRLDGDLLARAQTVAEWDKTTVTALITETLLEYGGELRKLSPAAM